MPVSLVFTTFNEQPNIERLLLAINRQTKKPDEVVIVDAASTDQTQTTINKLKAKLKFPVKLHSKPCNRSTGRNLAISLASHSIIAVTDAGCYPDKHWLERLTKPIKNKQADAVAGYYLPVTPTCFEKCVARFVATTSDQYDPATYLPSSRSVAFTKSAWKKAGRYPEHLDYCEDLVFARALKDKTRMVVARDAIVYWIQTTNFPQFFHQLANYATGDVQASYQPHLIKIGTVFLRYLIFVILPWIFIFYLLWPIYKHYRHLRQFDCLYYLPTLQIVADFAVMYGVIRAFFIHSTPAYR